MALILFGWKIVWVTLVTIYGDIGDLYDDGDLESVSCSCMDRTSPMVTVLAITRICTMRLILWLMLIVITMMTFCDVETFFWF